MNKRRCLTGGMVLHTHIKTEDGIDIKIDMPNQHWNEETCKIIGKRLHDAIEYALAPYWTVKEN